MTHTEEHTLAPSPAPTRSHRLAVRLLLPLAMTLAAIVIPLYIVYDVSQVDGTSMLPTLRHSDYLLITRGLDEPLRGEVVVVQVKNRDGSVSEIVKRIVAVGGDRVTVRGDYVTVNGAPEAFQHQAYARSSSWPSEDVVVPRDHVYVLGDNRPVSSDSRFIGALPLRDIHGRVVAVWFPVTRIRLVPSP